MEQGAAGESDFAFRRCVIVWVFREQARSYRSGSSVGCYQGAGSWTIEADEPAMKHQMCERLVRSAGLHELQDY
ncbi:hypothetical protein BMH52_00560 [Pseudomonas sp. BTN1]|nr:hypothetical protein BMH52_00560 [Pseudomonas sp. BTN1]